MSYAYAIKVLTAKIESTPQGMERRSLVDALDLLRHSTKPVTVTMQRRRDDLVITRHSDNSEITLRVDQEYDEIRYWVGEEQTYHWDAALTMLFDHLA